MKTVNNNGICIRYHTEGEYTNPALVMLHGFGNNAQNWYDLGYVDILKPHFYLILPDVRGFGQSDKPKEKEAYQYEYIASDILAVLDNEKIAKAHLFGSSVGALKAGYLATHFEDRFLSFIFQGISPFKVVNLKKLLSDILARTKEHGITAYVDELERLFDTNFPAHIRTAMEQCDPEALYAASLAEWPDQVDKFPFITKPCLIIIGEYEGITEDMQKATELIPNCKLEIIPGLDHAHAYWAGNQVAPLIVKFICS